MKKNIYLKKLTEKKIFELNSKFKNFLNYGEAIGCINQIYIYIFVEDLLKTNYIRNIKFINKSYEFTFKKIRKIDYIYFSKFFYKFRGSSIYCLTIPYKFLFFFLNTLKINEQILDQFCILPLIFMFNGLLYDFSIILNDFKSKIEIKKNIYNIIIEIYNFVYFFEFFFKNK